MRSRGRRERGVALFATGVFLLAMLALAAVVIEVSRLTDTATEVQVVADVGAMGAAVARARGKDEGQAIQAGTDVAMLNFAEGKRVRDSSVAIEAGHYDPTRDPGDRFHVNEDPHNAFRSTVAVRPVRYVMATILNGREATSVEKQAVAVPDCPAAETANFPMTICGDVLHELQPGETCTDQARLGQLVPDDAHSACWTSLGTGSASASAYQALLPTECGGTGGRQLTQGDHIEMQNGEVSGFLQAIQCCIACKDVHKFTIPVVDCSQLNTEDGCNGQAADIIGFATISIASYQDVRVAGGGSNNCKSIYPGCHNPAPDGKISNPTTPESGLYANQTCKTDTGGRGGSRCFGTTTVVLGQQ